ncbi:MAG: hypothetical protein JRI23_35165, partial [Deltaproteobacteria bacterium]|nr:hypothetical protein [Deltaproteobacteria bacterium]MBW2537554.1 hypothetical protein [Deltaproteobacteria bacterium]
MRPVAWWVLILGAVGLCGCKADRGEPCGAPEDCSSGLVCHQSTCRDPAKYCREDSALAPRCARDGACQLIGDRCVPGSKEDCAASSRCQKHGRCNFVDDCCTRADFCPHADEDPLTHLDRLSDPTTRDAALAKLSSLVESAVAQDKGDRGGPHAGPLLAELAAPLAELAVTTKLPVASQAKLLRLLAATRHPDSVKGLVAALTTHKLDGQPATPVDSAMSQVLAAVADLKPPAARQPVFRLYKSLNIRWKKASVEGFASNLERAVMALAESSWEKELIAMLQSPVRPKADLNVWLQERYRQRIAARVLGAMRSPAAIEPLLQVVLSPQKADIAPAAMDALTRIGKPAAAAAEGALEGTHEGLTAHARKQHELSQAQDLGVVTGRGADPLRVQVAAVTLAHIGRADGVEPVVAALDQTDLVGQGTIAEALPLLPHGEQVTESFKKIFETAPLDLTISASHQGIAALLDAMPILFDPQLVPWIVDQALGWPGTDTALAGFRESALTTALLLTNLGGLADVDRLTELITPEKYEKRYAACRQLLEGCKDDLGCYLKSVGAETAQGKPSFAALKAATMAGVVADPGGKASIAAALPKAQAIEVRRILAHALVHLSPAGDAALATQLTESLDARSLTDPVVGGAVARLRA